MAVWDAPTPNLVVERKLFEQILIDGDILVTVVAVRGERVKLSIQAPPDKSIARLKPPNPPP